MLKLASWNVNSIKMRLEQVLRWLDDSHTDILAIQETKTIDAQFPLTQFEEAGYHVVFSGQKAYNGVAIVSRYPISEVSMDIPDFMDPQKRVLAASIQGLRLVNVYVPNGASLEDEKYTYKLTWLKAMQQYMSEQIKHYPRLVMAGDYNIAPADLDVHDPAEWEGSVLVSKAERQAFNHLCDLGLQDSFRIQNPDIQSFSWWDYRAASFRRNRGLRIDHLLISEALAIELDDVGIDKSPRKWDKPSDHTPVWLTLKT